MDHRNPTEEELNSLEAIKETPETLELIPIVYRGEARYALGLPMGIGVVKLLAICVEYDSDKDKIDAVQINNLDRN